MALLGVNLLGLGKPVHQPEGLEQELQTTEPFPLLETMEMEMAIAIGIQLNLADELNLLFLLLIHHHHQQQQQRLLLQHHRGPGEGAPLALTFLLMSTNQKTCVGVIKCFQHC